MNHFKQQREEADKTKFYLHFPPEASNEVMTLLRNRVEVLEINKIGDKVEYICLPTSKPLQPLAQTFIDQFNAIQGMKVLDFEGKELASVKSPKPKQEEIVLRKDFLFAVLDEADKDEHKKKQRNVNRTLKNIYGLKFNQESEHLQSGGENNIRYTEYGFSLLDDEMLETNIEQLEQFGLLIQDQ